MPDERKRGEDILTLPTIVSLLTQKNQSGDTVLQDKTVVEDNFKMMLALAWSVLSEKPELIPEVREGILNLEDADFISHLAEIVNAKNEEAEESRKLRGLTIAALITYQDETNVPVLQDQNLSQRSFKNLISLALSVLKDVVKLENKRRVEGGEEEERRRSAEKVLLELRNIRSEPAMKEILSEERFSGVKDKFGL